MHRYRRLVVDWVVYDNTAIKTKGASANEQLLVLIHTERKTSVRIISARKATKYEKDIYEQG